ncbi:MAG: alpha/beta hydrolase [Dehalococcoidia bacterium]
MGLLPVRWLTRLLFPAAVLLLIGMWYYTDQLNQGAFIPSNATPPPNVRVVEVGADRIRLAPLDGYEGGAWNHDGLYGLEFNGGYARIGRVIDIRSDSVLRELFLNGDAPAQGSEARIDTFVYRGDPKTALNIDFDDVTVSSSGSQAPAWFIPGNGTTWAIFIHGKGANREEAFRILPSLHEINLPSLLISYRNDADYTSIEDGRYGYGETEWQDVAAAMDFARDRGAQRFVLIGNSMGGSIVMGTLQQPDYAALVDAVILDSPVLSLKQTVEFRAGQRKVPFPITKAALQFSTWRNGVDWTKTDYLNRADSLKAPILLFHGDADRVVPVSTSETLAKARPDLVTFRKLPGVDHVQAWNADRELYSLQVKEFLNRTLSR